MGTTETRTERMENSRDAFNLFKVGLSSSKKFVSFTSVKTLKIMKNSFCFMLKTVFVLEIFTIFSDFLVM